MLMAMKMGEIKGMKEDLLEKKLHELETELLGGDVHGTKISAIKLSIARIKTHIAQLKSAPAQAPKPKQAKK